jgi:hypothetical protein
MDNSRFRKLAGGDMVAAVFVLTGALVEVFIPERNADS